MQRRGTLIILICGGLILLAACGTPSATPTLQPTDVEPTSSPTVTPPSTALPKMPAGPYPPTLLGTQPRPGEEVASDTPLTLAFSQPMDQDSVADGLRIVPPVEGELVWSDDRTAVFTPVGLTPGTRYHVHVGDGVVSESGLPLSGKLDFSFGAVAPLEVAQVSPQDGVRDLRSDTPVVVTFNRPVVGTACVGSEVVAGHDCAPLPLRISPESLGRGIWTNSATYRYELQSGLAAGQTYQVSLDAGVTSLDGATLAEPLKWSFETAPPRVVEIQPASGQRNVPLTAGVRVVFNTPMDVPATGGAFSLVTQAGDPVAGTVTWEDGGATMVFTPSSGLELGTVYQARLGERARAATSAPLEEATTWGFETVPYPYLVSTAPQDGERGVGVHAPVRVTFAGAIDERTLAEGVVITPTQEPDAVFGTFDPGTGVYTLVWERDPQTTICLGPADDPEKQVRDVYGNPLTPFDPFCFVTGNLSPLLDVVAPLDAVTLDAGQPALLHLVARNVDRAEFALAALDAPALMQRRYGQGENLRTWTVPLDTSLNRSEVVTVPLQRAGGALPTGLYGLGWQSSGGGAFRQHIGLAVVDTHVTVKLSTNEALVWVTALASGSPISRTAVQLIDQEGYLIAGGTTDVDGIARLPISGLNGLWQPVAAVVGVAGEPGYGFALASWQGEASPGHFGLMLDGEPLGHHRAFVQIDRPLYRPGDRVSAAGWLRAVQGSGYTLPDPDTALTLVVRDPTGQIVTTVPVQTRVSGHFDTTVLLREDAQPGEYGLEVWEGAPDAEPGAEPDPGTGRLRSTSLAHARFTVEAYRKPELAVTVTPSQEDVIQGATAQFDVAVEAFSGESVDGVALTWTVTAAPAPAALAGETSWAWGDSADSGGPLLGQAPVARGTATLDTEGRATITLPARMVPLAESGGTGRQQWMLQVTATDASGLPVTGAGALVVHPAGVTLGLRPKSWVARARERTEVTVWTVDPRGEAVAEQDVTLALALRTWARDDEGAWVSNDTPIEEQQVTTGPDGRAAATFSLAQGGAHVIRAEARDDAGHKTTGEITLWVGGHEAAAWRDDDVRVDLVPDAGVYEAGDVARLLVPTSWEGPYQALVTVEQNGILSAYRQTFTDPNPILEIPIEAVHAPNVYVSCVLIGAGEAGSRARVQVGYANLRVSTAPHRLDVSVVPDRTTYEPGEPATVVVRARDAAGNPVEAEIVLAVVDRAVLALQTALPKTAATLSALEDVFYGHRALRVVTGDTLLLSMNRVTEQVAAISQRLGVLPGARGPAGMGGLGGGEQAEEPALRAVFPDTAYWEAGVRTGPDGEAQITFPLPDSLTTWAVHAWAVTDATEVGEGETSLVVSKPLSVRPLTPRFLVAGDEAELAAMVHNATEEALTVDVSLEAGPGLTSARAVIRRIVIPAGGRKRVAWRVEVADEGAFTASSVAVRFAARSGDYEDASAPTYGTTGVEGIPIHRAMTRDVRAVSGILEGGETRVESVWIASGEDELAASSSAVAVTLQIEPSLVAPLIAALEVPSRPRVDSTDAWVSHFLPAVTSYNALRLLGIDDTGTERARTTVADALDRLYGRQNEDGGWGWWQGWSNLHMTSYVVYGLLQAQESGFPVRAPALAQGLDYISATLVQGLETDRRHPHFALAFYVLSEAGAPWPRAASGQLYADRSLLGTEGQAYLALALGIADPSDPRVRTLLDDLRGAVVVSGAGAHWESANRQGWATDTQATAAVVMALARLAPEDPLLPQAVRWLMAYRSAQPRQGAYEAAWVVSALADYGVATEDPAFGEPGAGWRVTLNGGVLAEADRDSPAATTSMTFEAVLATGDSLLREGVNVLEVTRDEGPGRLAYTLLLEQVLPLHTGAGAQARGFSLERRYCAVTPSVTGVGLAADVCQPVTSVRVGEEVEVRLLVVVPATRAFVRLEDPHPAGFEPLGSTALTTAGEPRTAGKPDVGGGPGAPEGMSLAKGFGPREDHEDRVLFFAETLPAGVHEVRYRMRAAFPGRYAALPAVVEETAFPDVWGRSAAAVLTIDPPQ